jgi:replication factor C large subunit
MAARYELDESEVSEITGSGETTNKVQSIVEEAERRREEAAVAASEGAFEPAPDRPADDEGEGSASPDDGADAAAAATDGTAGSDGGDGPASDPDADPDPDPEERAESAAEDDQQSGLGDFV